MTVPMASCPAATAREGCSARGSCPCRLALSAAAPGDFRPAFTTVAALTDCNIGFTEVALRTALLPAVSVPGVNSWMMAASAWRRLCYQTPKIWPRRVVRGCGSATACVTSLSWWCMKSSLQGASEILRLWCVMLYHHRLVTHACSVLATHRQSAVTKMMQCICADGVCGAALDQM